MPSSTNAKQTNASLKYGIIRRRNPRAPIAIPEKVGKRRQPSYLSSMIRSERCCDARHERIVNVG